MTVKAALNTYAHIYVLEKSVAMSESTLALHNCFE